MREEVKGDILLAIEGELDVDKARQTEAEMKGQPSDGRLVLDLSRVPRFDFTGIITLLDALARLRDRFNNIMIQGLSERMGEIFMALRPPQAQWVHVSSASAAGRRH